jgi:hypothetical protein
LQKALSVLEGFYGKKAAALVQAADPAGPPPPPGFSEYKKNAASGGVMGMLQQIIDDAKAMEAEAIRSEEDAQKAYEDFVKETNASIEAAAKDMTNKNEEKAKAEVDLVEAQKEKDSNFAPDRMALACLRASISSSRAVWRISKFFMTKSQLECNSAL